MNGEGTTHTVCVSNLPSLSNVMKANNLFRLWFV